MRLLVLGGTWFVGRTVVERALDRGWSVTTFSRGRGGVDVPGARVVRGDRTVRADVERLASLGPWDAVVDTSGQVPAVVSASARALADRAGRYVFVSTVNVYRGWPTEPLTDESAVRETSAELTADAPGATQGLAGADTYGRFKAGCELAVRDAFADDRVLVLRPGVIHALIITRWRVDEADCAVLNSYRNLKITLLITHSGIDDNRIEPVDSAIAAASLQTAFQQAERYRTILYWRPIVPGLNDTDQHLERARQLTRHAHATVFTGLFYRHQIQAYYRDLGLPEPYDDVARRKILPADLEARVLDAFPRGATNGGPLFRKTSCAISYAHGLADYNGHYGISELCDICPVRQLHRCAAAWTRPDTERAATIAADLGGRLIDITDRAIVVDGLSEQPRYLMQHSLGYQVHDTTKPHHHHRHGRADIGWNQTDHTDPEQEQEQEQPCTPSTDSTWP